MWQSGLLSHFRSILFSRLGHILARTGNAKLAAICYREAAEVSGSSLPAFEEARALWNAGDHETAEGVIKRLLEREPEHPEANNLYGAMLLSSHNPQKAEAFLRRALAARPNFAAAQNNLGNVHRAAHDLKSAEAAYRTAIRCDANYVEALTNLGTLLNERGQYEDAEPLCRKAVALAPAFAGAHCNLGNVLLNLVRTGEAVAAYREALRLAPGLAAAHINLAIALGDPSYLGGAIEYYEQMLEREPDGFLPRLRIGQGLQALGRFDDAERRFLEARELRHQAPEVLSLLGNNRLCQGDAPGAIRCFREAAALGANVGPAEGIAFNALYLDEYSGEQLCDEARLWASIFTTGLSRFTHCPADFPQQGPIKIGYISRDFGRHSVAYFLEPIMHHHDADAVEVFCYCNLPTPDDWTQHFRSMAHEWRDISTLSDEKVAAIIKDDGIQVLIDLSGHTSGNRLGVVARSPAPVQVTYLGHPGTTGLDTVDYRLSDPVADPKGTTETHYTEKVWRLPRIFLAYQPPPEAPESQSSPCLDQGHITFGSFNNAVKISGQTVACWARILNAVPNSRLILKSVGFSTDHGRARLRELMSHEGILSERFELVSWFPDTASHLHAYGKIDIALDTFPYNGTTTTCEALWMGVPVVCLAGARHSGRVGASILDATGLIELVADDVDSYVRIAVELAGNQCRLSAMRSNLRQQMAKSPLMDARGLSLALEQSFRAMWSSWRDSCIEINESLTVSSSQAECYKKHLP